MFGSPIIEVDVHGMRVAEAINAIERNVNQAGTNVYKVRVIHGFNGGTSIRTAIREEFSYGRSDKVRRITMGDNEGITELILKEL